MTVKEQYKLEKLEEIDRTLEEIKGEVIKSDKPLFIECPTIVAGGPIFKDNFKECNSKCF